MRTLFLAALLMTIVPAALPAAAPPVAPNGIALFQDYRDWQVIAPSFREDKKHIRVILGNQPAVRAMRDKVRPLPDGAVLAKVAWTVRQHHSFPVATEPDTFVQVEFMVKDSVAYKATGGWGFARFIGNDLKPYGKDASFVQECIGCHLPVKSNDYLFTGYAPTPDLPAPQLTTPGGFRVVQ